jgi:hypothetical protein
MTDNLRAAVADPALDAFMDYFRRNYPGPETIIGRPDWHSPKIFRAAVHALKASGDLIPRADVDRLVDALKALRVTIEMEFPVVTGPVSAKEFTRIMTAKASAIENADAALTAWENRNGR